ncbi:hypothetical protein PG990_011274 [Apiospora arundinis]
MTESIIITTIGGGRVLDAASGRMFRTKSQDSDCRKYKCVMSTFEKKLPISIVIGSKNPNYPARPPRPFCFMGFFQITDIWAEKTGAIDGSLVSEYMVRLEKIDPAVLSWWMPDGHKPEQIPVGAYVCDGKSCDSCGTYSKTIYTEGWVCLSMTCNEHFRFGRPIILDELKYNDAFRYERHDAQGLLPLPAVIPALPIANQTSYEVKEEHIALRSSRAQLESTDQSILHKMTSGAGYPIEMYALPSSEGLIGGVVAVFRATPETCSLPNGPDNLYLAMQNEDLKLRRNPARAKGSRREELTSHFAFNYGAFYKFGVFVNSVGFKHAPDIIRACLAQLDWAQSLGITHASEFIQELETDYSRESMSLTSEKFNELLALGYFEGSKISYHDDGEKELGPTVATLSLGSPAVMHFRPKRKTNLGQVGSGKKGNKDHVISFVLNHGDIVIMHGNHIHRDYEHEVIPKGKLRFALTARFVRPSSITDADERARAIENGEVPEGIEKMAYKGHEEVAAAVSNSSA